MPKSPPFSGLFVTYTKLKFTIDPKLDKLYNYTYYLYKDTTMAANNRIPVKWIRDGAKSAYDKKDECFICGSMEDLELHHLHGMTNLLEKWAKDNKISLDTDEKVLKIRDRFIAEHHKELYVDVYTLCCTHHTKLHSVYTKSPALSTASKQGNWILKQKDKYNGVVQSSNLGGEAKSSSGSNTEKRGIFGSFVSDYNSSFGIRKA